MLEFILTSLNSIQGIIQYLLEKVLLAVGLFLLSSATYCHSLK